MNEHKSISLLSQSQVEVKLFTFKLSQLPLSIFHSSQYCLEVGYPQIACALKLILQLCIRNPTRKNMMEGVQVTGV